MQLNCCMALLLFTVMIRKEAFHLGIGLGELIFIIILIIGYVKPEKLPEYAKNIGNFLQTVRKYMQEVNNTKKEITEPVKELIEPLNDMKNDIDAQIAQIQNVNITDEKEED